MDYFKELWGVDSLTIVKLKGIVKLIVDFRNILESLSDERRNN